MLERKVERKDLIDGSGVFTMEKRVSGASMFSRAEELAQKIMWSRNQALSF